MVPHRRSWAARSSGRPLFSSVPTFRRPTRGALDPEPRAGVGRAHQRELEEVALVGAHVGADVEHDVEALRPSRGPEAGQRRPGDPGQLAQPQHRQRHQRAGVAAGDGDARLALAHRVERAPHRARRPAAHDVGGLGVHCHHLLGVAHRDPVGQPAAPDQGCQGGLVAVQKEAHAVLAARDLRQPRDHRRGAAVPAHGVDRHDGAPAVALPERRGGGGVGHGSPPEGAARRAQAASSSSSTSGVVASTSRPA